MGSSSSNSADGQDACAPSAGRGKRFWRRDFVGFATGVWASTAGSVVLASSRTETSRAWSYEPGVLIGVALVAPFVALLLTVLFKLWLAYRVGDQQRSEEPWPLVPLAAGLACIPLCRAVIYVLPKSPVNLFEILGMAIFLASPVISAEFCFRLMHSRKDGDRGRPAPSDVKR